MNETKDEQKLTIQVHESGEQFAMTHPDGVRMGVVMSGDPVKTEATVDVAQVDVAELQKLAVTNDIPADMLRDIETKATE